jgi:hypothetical protein
MELTLAYFLHLLAGLWWLVLGSALFLFQWAWRTLWRILVFGAGFALAWRFDAEGERMHRAEVGEDIP